MIDFALFESLLKCDTVEQLHAQTTLITQQLGFQNFLYGAQLNPALTPPFEFILNGFPHGWRAHYCELQYQKTDPVFHYCTQHTTPLLWEYLGSLPPHAKKIMDEAKDFGMASGASFSIRGSGGDLGIFSVTVEKNTKHTQKDIIHTMGSVRLLANYLHDSIHRIVLSKGAGNIENKIVGNK